MNPDKTLRPDQMEDLVHLMQKKRFLLASDPGCGKTPPACVYFWWLWSELNERTVWIMPKTIRKKNRLELLEWSGFKPEEVLIWEGEDLTQAPKVLIMTFKRWKISWKKALTQLGYGPGNGGINCLSGDETQLGWKGYSSQTVGSLNQSMQYIERFVPMTGTLIAGGLSSCYPVINLLCPHYYSGPEHFMATHAITDEYGNVKGWTNHIKLYEIILRHGTSRSFEDVHGKESKVVQVEMCDMAPKQKAKYDEFADKAILELEDRFLDGVNPGVMAIRCRQIMAHPECVRLPTEHDDKGKPIAWKEYDLTDGEVTGKDEQLLLHLEDHKRTGKPLVIFGTLIPELDRIAKLCRSVGLDTGVVHSKISDKICDQNLQRFEAQQLQVLVVSPTKAGAGLNWPFLDHMIFASMDYQDDHFLQAYRRAMRGKRTCPLRITILQYRNSLDQPIMAIVVRKSKDANMVDPKKQVLTFHGGTEDKSPQPAPKRTKPLSLKDLSR